MFVARGGSGGPVLVLVHGLGGTGEVWNGVIGELARWWPGSWVVPDLPGHGRSGWRERYSFGQLAADVAGAVPAGERAVVLGHSLGGVVGLALASGWFGVPVGAVCALGVKVRWSADELARAAALAGKPSLLFDTREEAAERALRLAGLTGLWQPDAPETGASVTEAEGGWRVTMDPATFGVGEPDLPGLLAAGKADVLMAAGEHDAMCPAEHLAALPAEYTILPGLGHNAHVERPAALRPLLERLLSP